MTDPSDVGRRGSYRGAKDRPPLREIPPAPLRDGERLLGALVGESTDTDSWAVGYLIAQPDGRVLVYVTPVGEPDPFGECELAGPDSPEAVGSVLDRMGRETAEADPPVARLYRRLGQAIREATSRTALDGLLAQVTPENVHPEAGGTAYFAAIQAIGAADSLEELDRVEAALRPAWADTTDWDSLREELAERHRELLPVIAAWLAARDRLGLRELLDRVTPENIHPEQMPVGGLPVSPSELLAVLAFADMNDLSTFDEFGPGMPRLLARLYKLVEAVDPELMRRWRDAPMAVARECARRGPGDRREPPMGPAPPREPGHGAEQWDVAPDAFIEEPPIGLPPGASAVRALLAERGDVDPVVRATAVELRRIIEGEGVASADGRCRVARVGGELYVLGPDGEPRPVADVLGGAAWLRHVADLVAGRIPESGPPHDAQRPLLEEDP